MKQYDIDRFTELMKFKIEEEKYITAYKGEILNCISFLLKDGNDYWVLEKGKINFHCNRNIYNVCNSIIW